MKAIQKFLVTMIGVSLAACAPTASQTTYYADQVVSVEVFYRELSPYGRWMEYAPYGYVWLPSVSIEFSPYVTQGHWVYTRYGWTWYSYYQWGWAPFHYGRWHYDSLYGWMWLPDIIWGPAWVVWRRGGGYCGWAPLGFGVSVHVVVDYHAFPHERWSYVRDEDLPKRNIQRHRVERSSNPALAERTTSRPRLREESGVTYSPGPDRAEIEQSTNRRINKVTIEERTSPGTNRLRNDRMEVYKPEMRTEREGEQRATPPRVYSREEIQRGIPDRRDENRFPETREPDITRQPDAERQPDISRQRRRQPDAQTPPTDKPQPPTREPDVRRQPPTRAPDLQRQPGQGQPPPVNRPSRSKTQSQRTAEDQSNRTYDGNRRN